MHQNLFQKPDFFVLIFAMATGDKARKLLSIDYEVFGKVQGDKEKKFILLE